MTRSCARSAALLVLLAFALVRPSAAAADGRFRPVDVMTRNLYLGADLAPAIAAGSPQDLAIAATGIWRQVQATDFPQRARALAAEIRESAPLLVGLQEVALWRTGPPDGPPSLGGTPATHVVYDFLEILLRELANGHLYEPVVVQQEADLESPTTLGFDVRLTMRDVILVRRGGDVRVASRQSANFAHNLILPIAGGLASVTSTRGWTAVDVLAKNQRFRFVNTHLEAFSNFFRCAQSLELLDGPLATTSLPIVLVGDLNSAPDDPGFTEDGSPFNDTNPYEILTAAGLIDTWTEVHRRNPGNTCCNEADLRNVRPTYVQRIDHVLLSEGDTFGSELVGDTSRDRTRGGLWPSDHAGVVATVAP